MSKRREGVWHWSSKSVEFGKQEDKGTRGQEQGDGCVQGKKNQGLDIHCKDAQVYALPNAG